MLYNNLLLITFFIGMALSSPINSTEEKNLKVSSTISLVPLQTIPPTKNDSDDKKDNVEIIQFQHFVDDDKTDAETENVVADDNKKAVEEKEEKENEVEADDNKKAVEEKEEKENEVEENEVEEKEDEKEEDDDDDDEEEDKEEKEEDGKEKEDNNENDEEDNNENDEEEEREEKYLTTDEKKEEEKEDGEEEDNKNENDKEDEKENDEEEEREEKDLTTDEEDEREEKDLTTDEEEEIEDLTTDEEEEIEEKDLTTDEKGKVNNEEEKKDNTCTKDLLIMGNKHSTTDACVDIYDACTTKELLSIILIYYSQTTPISIEHTINDDMDKGHISEQCGNILLNSKIFDDDIITESANKAQSVEDNTTTIDQDIPKTSPSFTTSTTITDDDDEEPIEEEEEEELIRK